MLDSVLLSRLVLIAESLRFVASTKLFHRPVTYSSKRKLVEKRMKLYSVAPKPMKQRKGIRHK